MTETIKNAAVNGFSAAMPNLFGRSTIELFDADSGRKVYQQTDENMVTNALQHLLNLPAEFSVIDNCSRTCLPALAMPFYKKALSGVLAFSENITEDAENISPTTEIS